ncbi:hypothetical protein LCGC14_0860770 [marine sediment metagenome]|uniref:Uncharacterized protein n=1 Tax=marine sediment metagenome TaxID=412755 RepID=A0A0F9PCJ0_9ZZZZ
MTAKKEHVPTPGRSAGLQGISLCGRWEKYQTRDHDQLRRMVLGAVNEDRASHYCKDCLRAMRREA